jgi:hypothetical protein
MDVSPQLDGPIAKKQNMDVSPQLDGPIAISQK